MPTNGDQNHGIDPKPLNSELIGIERNWALIEWVLIDEIMALDVMKRMHGMKADVDSKAGYT